MITPANVRAHLSARRVPFPHMGPGDTRVWRAVLERGLFPADSYAYDVRLAGQHADAVAEANAHGQMWQTLLKKRIDVVATRAGVEHLIEVKEIASFAALGQCLGYGYLWSKEKSGGVKPPLWCACAMVDPDLRACFAAFGVGLVVLPEEVALSLVRSAPLPE